MDLVRPEVLRQITLRLSAEAGRPVYLAQDGANGKIYVLSKAAALALRRMKTATFGATPDQRQTARAALDETSAREAYGVLHVIRSARLTELMQKRPFNPIFASLPLFDVGRFQPGLRGLAAAIVHPRLAVFVLALALAAVWLGARNDWQLISAFAQIFSPDALLTFGLVAPLLKLVHEFGHVLAATRIDVRVRKAGFYFVSLYPMPYVDCTEADFAARRAHRIAISCAGIVTDLIVGLLAFVLWHFVAGDFTKTVLANIFVFSTLNSVLFNANPLIKMDGYYALTDALGQRNLSIRAAKLFRDFRRWLATFGQEGRRPVAGQWALLAYALLSFFYRVNVMLAIALALLPRYLGLGAALALWGGVVMFATPLLRDQGLPPASAGKGRKTPGRRFLWGAAGAALAALLLALPLPFVVLVPMAIDSQGSYQITANSAGTLSFTPAAGRVKTGQILSELTNPLIKDQLQNLQMDLQIAEQILASVQGADPVRSLAASEQVVSLRDHIQVLQKQQSGLTVQALGPGLFVPSGDLHPGAWLEAGHQIGALFPSSGHAILTGDFPEEHVETWRGSLTKATLRCSAEQFTELARADLDLHERIQRNAASGARAWQLIARTTTNAQDMAAQTCDLRLQFATAPLWQHARFQWDRAAARFRDAQISDQSTYLQ